MEAASARIAARRNREQELVEATRSLFDERGMQHAPIGEIADAAGIARGLIYRHFSSKEELFVLTVTDYLGELDADLRSANASPAAADPIEALRICAEVYADFCLRYPAFLDCSLALMQRPANELREAISESVWLRLGRSMAACIDQLTRILRRGVAEGALEVDDPDLTANLLWTQVLGAMHLARSGAGIKRSEAGEPLLFTVAPEAVVRACVETGLAAVGASPQSA